MISASRSASIFDILALLMSFRKFSIFGSVLVFLEQFSCNPVMDQGVSHREEIERRLIGGSGVASRVRDRV